AILGGTTVTNSGFTVVNGNLGLSPLSSVTGFPPGVVSPPYTIDINNNAANQAQADLTTAYLNAATPSRAGSPPITQVGDLGGLVLAPGLYVAPSTTMSVGVGETLTLNGTANSVWVFQVGSSLTVLGSVVMTGGAQASNVFWAVNQSATIGSGAVMVGTIMAGASISLGTGATLAGRALAKAAVTMLSNPIAEPGPAVTGGVPPALTVVCPASTASVGFSYNSAVIATGGTTPYTLYSITPGVLPAGLALSSSTGAVTGTPTAAGANTFTANVTDSAPTTASLSCTITTSATPPTVPIPSSLILVLIGLACAALYGSREWIMRLAGRS
ncbi:MAG: ice-binding family protein, partial [Bryobacteraceae bacterium]